MGSLFSTPASLKRLSYTADKGTYSAVTGTLFGLFVPIDQSQQPAEVKAGVQAYRYQTDGSVTAYASDVLTVASVDYQVKGVRRFTMGSIDFVDLILEKAARQ